MAHYDAGGAGTIHLIYKADLGAQEFVMLCENSQTSETRVEDAIGPSPTRLPKLR